MNKNKIMFELNIEVCDFLKLHYVSISQHSWWENKGSERVSMLHKVSQLIEKAR